MTNFFRQAAFLTSAAKLSQLPADEGIEVAFVGRSNAGKSTAINTLTQHKGLARASNTPGRTQLINLFSLDELRRLVDLPGYGYAKVPLAVKHAWQATLAAYLQQRTCLKGLVVLMDCRHPLRETDQQLLLWAQTAQLPVHILLTKADKLSRNQAHASLQQVRKQLQTLAIASSCQLFSSLYQQGLEELQQRLMAWYQLTTA